MLMCVVPVLWGPVFLQNSRTVPENHLLWGVPTLLVLLAFTRPAQTPCLKLFSGSLFTLAIGGAAQDLGMSRVQGFGTRFRWVYEARGRSIRFLGKNEQFGPLRHAAKLYVFLRKCTTQPVGKPGHGVPALLRGAAKLSPLEGLGHSQ